METKNSSIQGNKAGSTRTHSFPWWGGKYRLAPEIVKHLPQHRIYVEVFGGAASVLLAKPPAPIEVYNDQNALLVNLFETIRNRPIEFLERSKHLLFSRRLHHDWQQQLFKEKTAPNPGDDYALDFWLEVAIRTYYVIVSSFVGDPTKGWAFDRTHHGGGAIRWANVADRIGPLSERFRHVNIDHLDFRECIENWDSNETLFYCDPPYFSAGTEGYYKFKRIQHWDLCSLLHKVKGHWLLSYDDVPTIRRLYRDCSIIKLSTPLMSKKQKQGTRRGRLRQILIANYDLEG